MTSLPAIVRSFGGLWPMVIRAARVVQREGLAGLALRARRTLAPPVSYAAWRAAFDDDPETDPAPFERRVPDVAEAGPIAVILPVYRPDRPLLEAAIGSVRGQIYPHWRLLLCDDGSGDPELAAWLTALSQAEPRIRLTFHGVNQGISAACNSALALADTGWFCTLDQDDLLRPHALLEVAAAIRAAPSARLIYSDEDKIDAKGVRFDPAFKPAWSPTLLRGSNYINHLAAARVADARALGGWRSAFDGAQDHDFWLRLSETLSPREVCHVPKVLYHWRAVAGSTALTANAKPRAALASVSAVEAHLRRLGVSGSASPCATAPTVIVRHAPPTPEPKVSVIIPNKDQPKLLEACLAGVRRSGYPNLEIIVVDNQSNDQDTEQIYEAEMRRPEFKLIRYPQPFNYSAMNNIAAQQATGAFLLLMNNDVEPVEPGWLTAMVAQCAQPGIGIVGAKLLYPNGSIQHAGVAVGVCGVAAHPYRGAPDRETGYLGRLTIAHEQSAVTAACLLIRTDVFHTVGGLDETDLRVAFNDVDLCLKVGEAGWRVIWTPQARLIHHESASRGYEVSKEKFARFQNEARVMARRWGNRLREDPYWPSGLTRTREDASLRAPGLDPAIVSLLRDVERET